MADLFEYTLKTPVYFYQCDQNKRLKLSMLTALLSETAGLHYTARGMDHDWLWERDCAFLLSRYSVAIGRMPATDEEISITTWECERTNGAAFRRDFEITALDGSRIIWATSDWIPVSPKTRKIIRMKDFSIPRRSLDRYVELPSCKRLSLREGQELGVYRTAFSDMDQNGHMFNAWYADVILDSLPASLRDKRFSGYEINYCREAKLGDELRLFFSQQDNTVLVKGMLEEKDCFVARLTLE